MEEEKKVIVKLVKEPLGSEREEIKEKKRRRFVMFLVCVVIFIAGTLVGTGMSYLGGGSSYRPHSDNKFDAIKEYLNSVWLYKNDYEDLSTTIEDKAYYGMTAFSDVEGRDRELFQRHQYGLCRHRRSVLYAERYGHHHQGLQGISGRECRYQKRRYPESR